jgi:hypothetical protein
MVTNIGRVEFIADLNGDRLPAQARALGKQMEAAGAQAGSDYGDSFETEFGKSLTNIGKQASWAMGRAGRLGAEDFADSIETALKRRQGGIQSALADTLIDKKKLQELIGSFDDVAEGMDHVDRELRALTPDRSKYADSILEAGIAVEKYREEEEERLAVMGEIAMRQEELADNIDRMNRLAKDESAFRRAATEAGRDYATQAHIMSQEMQGLNEQGQVSLITFTRFKDSLEKTIERLEQQDEAAAKLATNEAQRASDRLARIERQDARDKKALLDQIDRDERAAASAEELSKRRRLASFKAQAAFDAAIEREEEANRKATESGGKHADVIGKIGSAWRRMDSTVKLVIVSIVAAADEVAVLGSALGAGVIALGGALSGIAIGGLGLVGVFSQLNDELDDLPTNLRPAAEDFQALGKTFGEVGEAIAGAAIANAADAFERLDGNVQDLIPSLSLVGASVGHLIDEFSRNTQEGTDGFKEIDKAIRLAAPNFEALTMSAGQFGLALLRGVNRAQPLVEDLLGWVDKLVRRFDDFTRSDSFAEWIRNAQATFGAFGELLDAVGRSLNDLASPEAVDRTIQFLENLTAFTPHLETFLDTMGELDAFGLLAEALAKFGEALGPLAEPTRRLAETLNELISLNIDAFAGMLGAAAPVIGGVFDIISGFLDDVPPSSVAAVSGAIVALGVAIGGMNAVIGVSAAIAFFKNFTIQAGKMGPAAGAAAAGLGKLTKAAGLIGVVTLATGLLTSAFKNLTNASDMVAPSVEEILQSFSAGGGVDSAFVNAAAGVDTFAEAIKQVSGPGIDDGLRRFNSTLGGLVGIRTPVNDAADSIAALDATLAAMVEGGDAEKAAANFAALKVQAEGQGVSVEELTKKFPAYAEAVAGASNASEETARGFDGVAAAAGLTLRSVQDLADAISGFGDTQLTANDASRAYAQSVDDLNLLIAETGTEWGLSTEEGRKHMEAVDGIAEAALRSAEAIKENTGSQDLANAAIATGREELIKQLEQFGLTGAEAEAYADSVGLAADGNGELTEKERTAHADLVNQLEQFGLTGAEAETYAGKLEAIPGDVESNIALLGTKAATTGAEGVKKAIDDINDKTVTITVQTSYSGNPLYTIPGGGPSFEASGGISSVPRHVIFGEAGPEALVPLRRPLNQVDPSVRALSAIAQGKSAGLPSSDITGGTSRTVNVSPGAIVIQGDRAPEATATNVVNRIAQRLV